MLERATRQRKAIRAAIEAAKGPLSPREVLERARPALGVLGLATVYRTLKRLVEDGSVRALTLPGENARYEAAECPNHHRFQ